MNTSGGEGVGVQEKNNFRGLVDATRFLHAGVVEP